MATAKNRAIDRLRQIKMQARKHEELGRDLESDQDETPDLDARLDDEIGDDLLSLIFTACHPLLSTEARVALTLRLIGGLTTEEIARAFLVPEPTIAQRIVRAKRTLAEKQVPFEVPRGEDLALRLASVLEVIYLIFNEGYAATAGDDWLRPQLAEEALRLGRILAGLAPNEPEVQGLVALMEIQASRFPARTGADGAPILLLEQNRALWDRLLIRRGLAALAHAEERAAAQKAMLGPYALQAAIAACHARAASADANRLAADRSPLCGARRGHAVADRGAQSRRRGRHGRGPGGRSCTGRHARRRAGAEELSPLAERPRRPPEKARPAR